MKRRSKVRREQVLAFRARSSHLDERLPPGSLVEATRGGLQDSIPRAGVIGLHARVAGVEPDSWDDPSLAQIWFRGGADYIVPRTDLGVFTLGSRPRDAARCAAIDELADRALEVLAGRELKVREVGDRLGLEHPASIRLAAMSGRILIRWNASMIWLIGCERPEVDEEDARLELARRFLRWFAPQTKDRFRWWTGVEPKDATLTWQAIEPELVAVDLEGKERYVLASDAEALEGAEPIAGVRLIHNDDPYCKADHDLVIPDVSMRERVFPPIGKSWDYIPGAILVDGEVAGVWQRQQRRVTIHPWRDLPRDDVEREALAFPVSAKTKAEVRWEPITR